MELPRKPRATTLRGRASGRDPAHRARAAPTGWALEQLFRALARGGPVRSCAWFATVAVFTRQALQGNTRAKRHTVTSLRARAAEMALHEALGSGSSVAATRRMLDAADPTKLATVVVAEDRSACQVPFARLRGLAFLRQDRDEPLPALASLRLPRLLDRMRGDGLVVGHAWLLLNARHDAEWFAARMDIARMLGHAVARSGGSELSIVAPADRAETGRAPVLSLAEAMLERRAPGPLTVHVHFVPIWSIPDGDAPGLRKATLGQDARQAPQTRTR